MNRVHGSSMARWKARDRLLIVSPALTVEAQWADIGRNCGFQFERKEYRPLEVFTQRNFV